MYMPNMKHLLQLSCLPTIVFSVESQHSYRRQWTPGLGIGCFSRLNMFNFVLCRSQFTIIVSHVLHGCDTWFLILKEEHRLRAFENGVLRKIFDLRERERGSNRRMGS
jgi:hypothetical protein